MDRFWAVLWIDVSTTDVAERSLIDAAHKLSLSAQRWEDARLGIANLKYPWLLVLDNADTLDIDYQHYFPDGPLSVVLLTSRNTECRQYATTRWVALEGLEDDGALELLFKAAGVPQEQYSTYYNDAQLVSGLLQSHTLALIQAGAYVSRGHCTLAEYPQMFERRRRQLLAFRPSQARSRYGDVYATFEVSINTLTATSTEAAQDALQLLPLLAVCAPSRLPLLMFEAAWTGAKRVPSGRDDYAPDDEVRLLTPWHVRQLPPFLEAMSDTWNAFRLVEAVSLLEALSLITTDSHNGSLRVSMHALVHAWARERQNDSEQHQGWLRMGCIVAFALSHRCLSPEQERWLQLHVEALTQWELAKAFATEPPMLVARIFVKCGWYLVKMRADARLLTLMERIFQHLRLNSSEVDRHGSVSMCLHQEILLTMVG